MTDAPIDLEKIAHVCHEANRALQVTQGDPAVSPHFSEAPEWQVQSALEGVQCAMDGATPKQLHESWLNSKIEDGWCYGTVKDADKKTHPCIVPYDELPEDQRIKDRVFNAIVKAFQPEIIPFAPKVAPLGIDIGPESVQEVWDTFVKPDQESDKPQSAEMRVLMAILRAAYLSVGGK